MKNLRFSSRPRAKVRRQGSPGSARALHALTGYALHLPNRYWSEIGLGSGFEEEMTHPHQELLEIPTGKKIEGIL